MSNYQPDNLNSNEEQINEKAPEKEVLFTARRKQIIDDENDDQPLVENDLMIDDLDEDFDNIKPSNKPDKLVLVRKT